MINMNINEIKKLKFGVAVSGVQTRDLNGTMRILVDNIEYGFKTSVLDDKILVEIPPLSEIIKSGLNDGRIIKATLDIKIADTILQPWADTIKLITPVTVEAVISEEEDVKKEIKPTIKTEVVEDINIKVEKKVAKVLKEVKTKKPAKKTRMSKIFGE